MLNVFTNLPRVYWLQMLCLCCWLWVPAAQAQDSSQAVAPGTEAPASYSLSSVEIRLSRGQCFGTCPAYQVRIFGDGRVVYRGRNFVRVEGEQQAVIDKSEVLRLLERLYQIHFFDMKDGYYSQPFVSEQEGEVTVEPIIVSDVPSVIVSVRLGEYEKTVSHDIGGPPDLKALFDFIDEVAGTKRWIE